MGSMRNRGLGGFKFVRQEPIGPFIADFACRERKLVIELDGETHSTDEELAADARRTAFLNAQGYAVMRFTNQQLYENADAVAEAILAVLVENSGQSPKPLTQPLPARGERGSSGFATDFCASERHEKQGGPPALQKS
ncbi:hypothetical protein MJC1_03396 [Methylocystis sp. MJC1]|jgi:very-short-patch-repair endonuclease|uniref:endonuclease domain-containing protein n=2 Tax=Methylocystis sp. MJC1 TaxID=2654282 RepID=UPI002B4003BD|nr:endonuclease domain-containing protein [Methylocystis sp. MJC1]KAF2989627.1 hypothetical protein MJC1_03396 [Methylocystis sp. MJC1]